MLTEGTKEMDFQLVLITDVNSATDSARQVLLAIGAWSNSAKGAKYSACWGEHEAPNPPGKQSCARHPPTLKRDTQRVCKGLKNPSGLGRATGG